MEGDKRNILIVDDDTFLLDMYALKFSQNNFTVFTAPSAAEAINKLKEGTNFEVILMDVIMPEMDGFEMLQKINEEKLAPDATKIILSNKGQQSDVDQGKALGVDGYIVKANSTPAEVIDQVLSILAKKIINGK
jgi:CheY-like chemotaxis protein